MAKMNFGGVIEEVMTREEFPLEKAREVLKNETIAVLGYGVQGPGQACNLRDNGFNVIVGQRQGKTYEKAVADGWVPGETLFSLEEAAEKGTIVCLLLSDAAQMQLWPSIKPYLTAGKTLYFSHGFAITWNDRTGVVPPKDIDGIGVVPEMEHVDEYYGDDRSSGLPDPDRRRRASCPAAPVPRRRTCPSPPAPGSSRPPRRWTGPRQCCQARRAST